MKIIVLLEQHHGEARKASLQTLGLGLKMAADFPSLGKEVTAIVPGAGATAVAKGLGAYGVKAAATLDDAALDRYLAEQWVEAVAPLVEPHKPFLLLMGCSAITKDIGPRLAQRLGAGYLNDVTGLETGDGGKPRWVRPIFAGKAYEHIDMLTESAIVTIRPNSFPLPTAAGGAEATITVAGVPAAPAGIKLETIEVREGGDQIELTEAEIIVTGGIGLGGPEGFEKLRGLCKVLGAALGSSRAAVHAEWIGADHQVGQTGKTVSPQLYIACGVSGAIQHQAGMRTSKCIVAINTDAEAPIFKIAHYGICADLHAVVPALVEEFRKVVA